MTGHAVMSTMSHDPVRADVEKVQGIESSNIEPNTAGRTLHTKDPCVRKTEHCGAYERPLRDRKPGVEKVPDIVNQTLPIEFGWNSQ